MKSTNWKWVLSGATVSLMLVVGLVRAQQGAVMTAPAAAKAAIAVAETNVSKGQRIVTTTHSFNVFVFQSRGRGGRGGQAAAAAPAPALPPLAQLCKEVGIEGQEQVELQMLGNSTPTQHWNAKGGDDNPIKVALRAGNFDVFTLAPHREMPEPSIDKFADLACKANPNCRIMAQISWSSWDGKSANGRLPDGTQITNDDHNKMTREELTGAAVDRVEDYAVRLREQLASINQRYGRSIGYVVPVSQGVLKLRVAVLDGKVPGMTKQSDIFVDAMGHGGPVLQNLATYCWFACMYGKNPVGLTSFVKEGDADSAKTQRLLQEIALEVVSKEPMSGFPKSAAVVSSPAMAAPSRN